MKNFPSEFFLTSLSYFMVVFISLLTSYPTYIELIMKGSNYKNRNKTLNAQLVKEQLKRRRSHELGQITPQKGL